MRCASLGRLWPSGWAPGHGSRRSGGRPDGPPVGRAEGHGPDAWQRPGSSRAVRCGSLGGSGRADGRASGPGSGQSAGRPDGPPAGRAEGHGLVLGNGRIAPGRCAVPPWGGPGRAGRRLRAVRRTARRATGGLGRGPRGGRRAEARQLRRGALRLPWAALGLPMCPARAQSAPRAVLQIRPRRRILCGSWRCAVS